MPATARIASPSPPLEPRGMTRAAAAAWLGVSPGTFDTLVAKGELPGPIRSEACSRLRRWDRLALAAAFFGDKLPDPPADDAAGFWDAVA